MTLRDFPLLTDENIDPDVVEETRIVSAESSFSVVNLDPNTRTSFKSDKGVVATRILGYDPFRKRGGSAHE